MTDCFTKTGIPKRRFESRAAAKAYIKHRTEVDGVDMSGQKPYRCDECGYFHLGHYPKNGLRHRRLAS